jgi:hypothetical protein
VTPEQSLDRRRGHGEADLQLAFVVLSEGDRLVDRVQRLQQPSAFDQGLRECRQPLCPDARVRSPCSEEPIGRDRGRARTNHPRGRAQRRGRVGVARRRRVCEVVGARR